MEDQQPIAEAPGVPPPPPLPVRPSDAPTPPTGPPQAEPANVPGPPEAIEAFSGIRRRQRSMGPPKKEKEGPPEAPPVAEAMAAAKGPLEYLADLDVNPPKVPHKKHVSPKKTRGPSEDPPLPNQKHRCLRGSS